MGEWKATNLGGVTTLVTKGTTPPNGKGFVDVGVNYIKSDSLNYDGRIDTSLFVAIDPETHNTFKRSQIKAGDILFSMAGAFLGKSGIATESMLPANTNQAVAIIRPDPSIIDSTFLGLFFRQKPIIDFVNNLSGQSAQPNINFEEIRSIELMLPELTEQRAIASVLSSLDAKIDLLHRQNKTLEAMAETLFRQWFVEEAEEGWEEVRIGDYIGTNERSLTKDTPLASIKYLDTGAITKGHIEGFQELALKDAPSRARRLVRHNDIVYSTVRPIHCHYGLMKGPPEDLVVSTGFCVITAKTLGPHFVYYLLTTPDMTEYLHSVAEGSTSTYPSLKPSDIEAVEFQLPPKKRMAQFESITSANWDRISNNYRQIQTLTALRDTLLPKLMSGEVRVDVGA